MVKKKNIYTVDLSEVKDKVETSKTIHIHIYKKKIKEKQHPNSNIHTNINMHTFT